METVYIFLNLEAGWDCIIGVFGTLESLKRAIIREFENDWDSEALLEKFNPFNFDQLDLFLGEECDAYAIYKEIVQN